MECKICGYRARDIAGMARHYRKEHPSKMSRRTRGPVEHKYSRTDITGLYYCPVCGKKL